MSSSIKRVSLLFLMLLLKLPIPGISTLICSTNGQGGCQGPSLADLFDRVIQHSARVHGLSTDLHSQFEQYFLPSKNQIGRISRNCHTSYILTPKGKENAQSLAREELTELILKLLSAWRKPLLQFHQSMSQHEDFTAFSRNQALQLSDMVRQLKSGVERVAEKMQLLGIIGNSLSGFSSDDPNKGEAHSMGNYELLYCFRRDSNKVQNYLNILKCRITPENGC